MTNQEKDKFEKKLAEFSYKKLLYAKSNPQDDFEWYKVVKNSRGKTLYQIFYQFWNFGKYGYDTDHPWKVSIEVIPNIQEARMDFSLDIDWFTNIVRVENVASLFYFNVITKIENA